MELQNKKLSNEQFENIRKDVMNQWPTGKDVDLKEAFEYQKAIKPEMSFGDKLSKAKKDGETLIQPRAGVALIDEHIELLQFLQDSGEEDFVPSNIYRYTRNSRFY